jgi:hypothetical protein
MDTDRRNPERVRALLRARRPSAYTVLWLLMGVSCFAQRPSSESAPSSAPEAPAPATPALAEPAPPAAPAESPERKRQQSPGSGKDAAESSTRAARPPAATVPLAPQKRAAPKDRSMPKSKAEDDRGEREIGGAANEEANPHELRQRLDRAYRAGSPDCPSARDRKKAVCDLASQICQLIDRDPNVASVAEYCADAKDRCAEAERRTRERCPD